MSAERTEDDDYDIPAEVVKNAAYCTFKTNTPSEVNTIATSVPALSYNVGNTENSKKEDTLVTKKYVTVLICLMAFLVGIAFLISAGVGLIAFVQISKLRSDVVLLQSISSGMETVTTLSNNFTKLATDEQFSVLNDQYSADITRLELGIANLTSLTDQYSADFNRLELGTAANLISLNEVNNRLENISDSLSIQLSFINQENTGNTNSLKAILVSIFNETGLAFASCVTIQQFSPSSPSGNYHVRSSNGSSVSVYCDMTRSCGNITGGWMRVAELDMRDNTTHCPSSLELMTSPRHLCRAMNPNTPTCSSDTFTVDVVGYSKVCGRIRGYQVGSLDAFGNSNQSANSGRESSNPNIETYYVDGVSLTHGTTPRQHIWTFAGTYNDGRGSPNYKCPCINPAISVTSIPLFVGNDYFCDTAVRSGFPRSDIEINDPLWDGAGCGTQNTCCSFNTPPWFYKQLPQPTTDDIEMRVCRDHVRSDEDVAIEVVEIYVQ